MADKVAKSLDDIIKENKTTRGPGGPGGNRRGGMRRGGGAGGRGRFGGGAGPAAARGSSFPRRQNGGGAIQKRRSGGGNASLSPNKASAINGKWSHDLYQNGGAAGAAGASAGGGTAKLVISNLDFGVNDNDIENLFQEFGRLKRASIHYDRSGRSLGTAEVLFERRSDAIRAMNHYNGVSLDGRPMTIEVVGATSPRKPTGPPSGGAGPSGAGPRRFGGPSRGGFRRGGGGGGRGGAGAGRGGPRGSGGNRQPKPQRTAADLDADLDAHNAKMQTD